MSKSSAIQHNTSLSMSEQIAVRILQEDGWNTGELAMCFNVGTSTIERLDPNEEVEDIVGLVDHVTPDTALQTPSDHTYSIDDLVDAYAHAVGEIGHKTLSKAQYRANKPDNSPSTGVFANRWGTWTMARKQIERRL